MACPQQLTHSIPILRIDLSQNHDSEDRIRRLIDVVSIAIFLADGAIKRSMFKRAVLGLLSGDSYAMPAPSAEPRAAQEARAKVITLLTGEPPRPL